MFTGLVQAMGEIVSIDRGKVDARLRIAAGKLPVEGVAEGDSICVNGACLTAITLDATGFAADVSRETLDHTALGDLAPGAAVNLETSLTLQRPLGGHLVTGHVDGTGEVTAFEREGKSWRLTVRAPDELARYIARKGSICVDGVSLTVNDVDGAFFGLNIVPHTLRETIIGGYRPGSRVNLEVDIIARYLERLLLGERAADPGAAAGLTRSVLREHGFVQDQGPAET